MIEIKKVMEHFEIYVDGEFNCSCDSSELNDTVRKLEQECNDLQ